MAHKLFTILDEFDLLSEKDRLRKAANLRPSDWLSFSDKLAESVLAISGTPEGENRPFELWFPYSSLSTLDRVPSYSFLFDKVYVAESLSDFSYSLSLPDSGLPPSVIKQAGSDLGGALTEALKPVVSQKITALYKDVLIKKADLVITHYLQIKDLIDAGVVIPYVDWSILVRDAEAESVDAMITAILEKQIGKLERPNPERTQQLSNAIVYHGIEGASAELEKYLTFTEPFLDSSYDILEVVISTLGFKSLFPSSRTPNIDLGGETTQEILDQVVSYMRSFLPQHGERLHAIQWPRPEDELVSALLVGIPPQELLSIREKETAAIQKWRYELQKRLLSMQTAIGTKDYPSLIRSLRVEQNAQIAELTLLAESIKKDYMKRITYQVGMVACSAAAAILSASMSAKDPAILLGAAFGGAGLSAGLAKIAETLISYEAEVDKLRQKDSYILWRIQQGRKVV